MGTCSAVALLVAQVLSVVTASNCWAASREECLVQAGCRWYAYRQDSECKLCSLVYPDSRIITGCRDWTPFYFCQRIYSEFSERWGVDPGDGGFRKAVQRYSVSQGSGEPGNPRTKRWRCSVWCDASTPYGCEGQPKLTEEFRGVNYGGRFVPERYLGLPGTAALFDQVKQPQDVEGRHVGSVSLCDVGHQVDDASKRVADFLDANIKPEHFRRISDLGFNVVRLPLGYWNLIDLPGNTTPNGLTPERWRGLQHIMPAQGYRKWIKMVFDYAAENGLQVLMDFHGAPGGQTGNAFTGCDTGKGHCHFDTPWNKKLAVLAVEKMAELCNGFMPACYGIELLNEPAAGRMDIRPFLKDFYEEAMKAARRHLDSDVPLVIMDWTRMLPWWKQQKPFGYREFGRVVFATHFYDGFGKHGQLESRAAFQADLETVEDFFFSSKYEVIVSEYGVSGHGSGDPEEDTFDYHSLVNWLVHQMSQRSLGSAIWNYDAAVSAASWGPVAHDDLGRRPIRWRDIFEMGAQDADASTQSRAVAIAEGEVRPSGMDSQVLVAREPAHPSGGGMLDGLLSMVPTSAPTAAMAFIVLAAFVSSLALGSFMRTATRGGLHSELAMHATGKASEYAAVELESPGVRVSL